MKTKWSWNKITPYLDRVTSHFLPLIPQIQSHAIKLRCILFLPSMKWRTGGSRAVHTVVQRTILYASLRTSLIQVGDMFDHMQKDHLHSTGATTIPVDSFRRDFRVFLHKVHFVWLPTKYCQCTGCAHLCLGLGSLGCGSLLGSRIKALHMSLKTFVPGNMWACMIAKSVSLSCCPTTIKK